MTLWRYASRYKIQLRAGLSRALRLNLRTHRKNAISTLTKNAVFQPKGGVFVNTRQAVD